ncbi:unnamed protein product [Rotaria magnacalcarata]|uniref:RecF/RecN/SMC N-terminal domain-containing protein n=1 Tax=Rotaria magnacalcarata TaxID=392030 RepID=A0A815L2T1_9BILA|nr:unnamed protein product [Rotaria magnacalcarata]
MKNQIPLFTLKERNYFKKLLIQFDLFVCFCFSFKSAPLFLLDDVDVALDNTNIGKVADFIREQSASKFQCIVISLKEQFYSRAGALTTIFPKPGDCITSYCFTLGLNQFDERENIANRRG